MTLRHVRVWPGPLRSIRAGTQRYLVETELDGKWFNIGQRLVLEEWVDKPGDSYGAGNALFARVTHITRSDAETRLPPGVVVLGIERIRDDESGANRSAQEPAPDSHRM